MDGSGSYPGLSLRLGLKFCSFWATKGGRADSKFDENEIRWQEPSTTQDKLSSAKPIRVGLYVIVIVVVVVDVVVVFLNDSFLLH